MKPENWLDGFESAFDEIINKALDKEEAITEVSERYGIEYLNINCNEVTVALVDVDHAEHFIFLSEKELLMDEKEWQDYINSIKEATAYRRQQSEEKERLRRKQLYEKLKKEFEE